MTNYEIKEQYAFKKHNEKMARLQEKHKKDVDYYNAKLRELAAMYFKYRSSDEISNKENYDALNNEWRELAKKVNVLSKVKLKFSAFEEAIEHISKKEVEYKQSESEKNEDTNRGSGEPNNS